MTINTFGMQQSVGIYNIDSGSRQLFSDVGGNPIRIWDSRGHTVRMTYDELRRPIATYLTKIDKAEIKVQCTDYGSSKADNSIGQVIKAYDQSGLSHISKYDFKGNPLESTKQFCEVYDTYIDWDNNPVLQSETFISQFSYDALNRPVNKTLPNGTVETYTYNKAGLLEKVHSGGKDYVTNINYNEKGQRTDIYYGNNSKTKYEYDSKTFRLTRLLTTRNLGADVLQDLNYTYDAVGNIVQQNDNAQQTHYFSNSVIEPKGLYYYDALYRLIKAKGRELSSLAMPNNTDIANTIAVPNTAANAMQNYTQEYTYDELGNMMQLKSVGQWTRDYFYNFNDNNYLLGHTDGQTDYTYDAHGNMLSMPHLQALNWDYRDVLTSVDLDVSGNKAYYVYDASGERVRKVVIKGNIKEERYYFGDYEVYRKFENNMLKTERTTINVSDDKKKIVTIDKLTVDQGSLTTNPMPVIRYQYDNHLGSASLELDDLAEIISYEEYHPFGTTSYRSGRTETETSQKRYKYVGKERDEETGLYYYGARYYAAWICRFVSVDPLKEQRNWLTPYNYVQNNPINRIDPDGRLDTDDDPPNQFSQSNTKITKDESGKFIDGEISSFSVNENEDGSYTVKYSKIAGKTDGEDIYISTEKFNETVTDFEQLSDFAQEVFKEYHNKKINSEKPLNLNSPLSSVNDGMQFNDEINDETQQSEVVDHAVNAVGGAAKGMQRSKSTYRVSKNGKISPKVYESGWKGGSRAKISTHSVAKAGKLLGRASFGVSLILGGLDVHSGYEDDGNEYGENAQLATGRAIGGISGAAMGASIGAAIGAPFAGIGAIPGAVIGGIIGSVIFGIGGSYAGEKTVEKIHKRKQ